MIAEMGTPTVGSCGLSSELYCDVECQTRAVLLVILFQRERHVFDGRLTSPIVKQTL